MLIKLRNIANNLANKRGFLFLVLGILSLILPRQTFAFFVLDDVAGWVISKIVFVISYILSALAGLFIMVEAWIVEIVLTLNTHVINSAPVKLGLPVTLSIVNLGFVFAIIVIAVMTILRRETYGIKQILWKLVVAAILVNFSIVIAGAILNFSDQFTFYFLRGIDPSASSDGRFSGFNNFATELATAFNPQREFLTTIAGSEDASDLAASIQGGLTTDSEIAGKIGTEFGEIFAPIGALVFVVFSLFAIVVTLGCLIVMLIVRYVTVALLLVLMPFVWLLWIFPLTHKHWDTWWNEFIRWAFFPPIVVFFLWLGIQMSRQIGSVGSDFDFAPFASQNNDVWASIVSVLSSVFTPIIENTMQAIVLVGVMMGGIFAANKMSITGASIGMNAAKAVGGAVGGWAKAKGQMAYSGVAERVRKGATNATDKMAEKQRSSGLIGKTFYGAAKYATGWTARGAAALEKTGSEDVLAQYEESVKHDTMEQINAGWTTASMAKKVAWTKKMAAGKDFDRFAHYKDVGSAEMKEAFGRFGSDNKIRYKEDVNKAALADQDTSGLIEKVKGAKTNEEKKKASGELKKNYAALFARMKKGEFSKAQLSDFLKAGADAENDDAKFKAQIGKEINGKKFTEEDYNYEMKVKKRDFGLTNEELIIVNESQMGGILEGAPDMVLPAISTLKQRGLDKFEANFKIYMAEQRAPLEAAPMPRTREVQAKLDSLDKLQEKVRNSIIMNSVLSSGYGVEGEAKSKKDSTATEHKAEPAAAPPPPETPPAHAGGGGATVH